MAINLKNGRNKFKMFSKNKLLILGIMLIISTLATSQSVKRLELPFLGEKTCQVVPLKNLGVLLMTKIDNASFTLILFDTNLEQVWSKDGALDDDETFINYTVDTNNVYLLFSKNNDYYEVIKVSTAIGLLQKFTFVGLKHFEISEFKAHKDALFLRGMVKEESVLLKLSLNENTQKVIAGGFRGTSNIQSLDIDNDSDEFSVTYLVKNGHANDLIIKRFAEKGNVLDQRIIESKDDFRFRTGKLFQVNDSTEFVIGDYGFQSYESYGGPSSQGIYISKANSTATDFIKYHSFTDFKNFFKFLPEKEQGKIERKIEKKKDKGDDLRLDYHVLLHDIIQRDGQYILIAEIFYPEFRPINAYSSNSAPFGNGVFGSGFNTRTGIGSWSSSPLLYGSGNQRKFFDGFHFTHTVVAGFDEKGNLLWDNSFGFDEQVKTMELKENVKVKMDENDLTLVYNHKGKLNMQVLHKNNLIDGNKFLNLFPNNNEEKLLSAENDGLQYWFNNFYLAWGNQKILSKTEGKRNVFYLNKIAF